MAKKTAKKPGGRTVVTQAISMSPLMRDLAKKRAADLRRNFSNYVTLLIESDLQGNKQAA